MLSLTGESIRHKSSIRGIALNFTTDLLATCSNDPKICLSSFDSDYSKVGMIYFTATYLRFPIYSFGVNLFFFGRIISLLEIFVLGNMEI